MNILIYGDNRNVINWGARSAKPALSQILSQVTPNIHYLTFPNGCIVGTKLSPRYSRQFYIRQRHSLARAYVRMEEVLGANFDLFNCRNADVMVKNFFQYKDRYTVISNLLKKIMSSDVVIIDGNGDLILDENRVELHQILAMIGIAEQLNKKIILLNSIVSYPFYTETNRNIDTLVSEYLGKCNEIYVRDFESASVLKKLDPGIDVKIIPDSLFYWYSYFTEKSIAKNLPVNGDYILPQDEMDDQYFNKLNFEKDYICVTGGAGAAKKQVSSIESYCNLVKELKKLNRQIYLVPTCRGDRFLYKVAEITDTPIVPATIPVLIGGAILANSKLLISGRYHPSILAAFGGTPTIFLEADSHKTRSIQPLLGYKEPILFSANPGDQEIKKIYQLSVDYLRNYKTIKMKVSSAVEKRFFEVKRYVEIFS